MDSEDGQVFIKVSISTITLIRREALGYCCTTSSLSSQNLAHFVRTHEKALANALQLRRQNPKTGQSGGRHGDTPQTSIASYSGSAPASSASSTFAAALSLGTLNFTSHNIKAAKLTLTPHHLFFLLSRFEDIGIQCGPMNIRLENIHTEASPANYVSFLGQSQRSRGRGDRDSIHSVSSVRSVMSGISALWSNLGITSSNGSAKTDKTKAQMITDLKYLYSAFTKIPCLRLSPDRRARLIGGYEEFPFDTAVPLHAFKNISALEVCDVDFRQFFGWDRLADQLRSLVVKRGDIEDPMDLFTGIVLDDMDKRRRRSSKSQISSALIWPSSLAIRYSNLPRCNSAPGSPVLDEKLGQSLSPKNHIMHSEGNRSLQGSRTKSQSPNRPSSSKNDGPHRHIRGNAHKVKRSGSGSSNSSTNSTGPHRSGSASNLLTTAILPASKWRFLRHVSLADNSLVTLGHNSMAPLANTLHSLDLSSNLFTEIPDGLAALTALRSLNLCNCMIESLHSLAKCPLPAITALNLRANRLLSLAGIERLPSLERLDLRENKIPEPIEAARLTGIPNLREIWIMGNPLTKTHSTYRVTIFNLFRATPGFLEDILIDAAGPGYSERRQLRDRVVELESIPLSTPPSSLETLGSSGVRLDADTSEGLMQKLENEEQQRSSAAKVQSEFNVGTGRRIKSSRRRIVDLSRDEGSQLLPDESPVVRLPNFAFAPTANDPRDGPILNAENDSISASEASAGLIATRPPKPASSVSTPSVHHPAGAKNNDDIFPNELQNLNLNGEAYRQRVEALKNEVGSNWLSVLREEGWNEHRTSKLASPDLRRIDVPRSELPTLCSPNHGILSGSGTLG